MYPSKTLPLINRIYKIVVWILFSLMNRRSLSCAVGILWQHRFFTSIHRVLPCQIIIRPAIVGARSACLRDTPWPNREWLYLHIGHSLCRITTISPDCLSVKRLIMREELLWSPGINWRWLDTHTFWWVLVVEKNKTTWATSCDRGLNTVHPD